MEDPINANPTVIDISHLPTRRHGVDEYSELDNNTKMLKHMLSLSLSSISNSKLMRPETESGLKSDNSTDSLSDLEDVSVMEEEEEVIDEQEIFDLLATISDPEHPLTLAQLAVVNLDDIHITHGKDKNHISEVLIKITPTITHCSLATLIGLGIRVRLERCLPQRFRIRILIKEGSHQSENQVNKQLNDKERVAAACENDQLLSVILQMLSTCQ